MCALLVCGTLLDTLNKTKQDKRRVAYAATHASPFLVTDAVLPALLTSDTIIPGINSTFPVTSLRDGKRKGYLNTYPATSCCYTYKDIILPPTCFTTPSLNILVCSLHREAQESSYTYCACIHRIYACTAVYTCTAAVSRNNTQKG